MSQARWVERSLFPWAVVLQTVPILAIVPLIGFWWGFDFRSRVLVCVLIAIFPMITNTLFGLRSGRQGCTTSSRCAGRAAGHGSRSSSSRQRCRRSSSACRISAGLSVIGAIVGDFFFRQGDPGIGRLIDNYRAELASEQLFAAIAASSLLGIAAFALVGWAGELVVGRWHESGRRRQ